MPMHKKGKGPKGVYTKAQVNGFKSNLIGAINACNDGAYVTLDLSTAHGIRKCLEEHARLLKNFETPDDFNLPPEANES